MEKQPPEPEPTPFERFASLTKRLLAVPKKEAQEQAEQEKRDKERKERGS